MKWLSVIRIFISIFILTGCKNAIQSPVENEPQLRTLTFSEKDIIKSNDEITFKIWKDLGARYENSNLIFSPLSIDYALAMTYNGAGSATAEAIRHTLSLDSLTTDQMNSSFQTLTDFLLSLDNLTSIDIANSVWYSDKYNVRDSCRNAIITYYNGETTGLNFSDPSSKNIINDWVSEKTNGKITKMVDNIPGNAVMYLVNAVYFKADWEVQFDKNLTKKENFYMDDGQVIQVNMMDCKKPKLLLERNDNFTLVDIPYGNGQFALTVLMPAGSENINALMDMMTEENYKDLLNSADSAQLELELPKFTIESDLNLDSVLWDLGMKIAYSDSADFSNLFQDNLPLAITSVLHKAKMEVDEEGTEAAASTSVTIGTSVAVPEEKIVVNRPFLFIIHERYTNTILFCGKILNPS